MTVENTTNRSRVPNLSEEMSSSQSFQTAKGEMRETIQTSQGPTANQEGPSEEARIAELTQPRGLKAGQVLGQGPNKGVTTAEQRAKLRNIRIHPSNELEPLDVLSRTTEKLSEEKEAVGLDGNPTSTGKMTVAGDAELKYHSQRTKFNEGMKYS